MDAVKFEAAKNRKKYAPAPINPFKATAKPILGRVVSLRVVPLRVVPLRLVSLMNRSVPFTNKYAEKAMKPTK